MNTEQAAKNSAYLTIQLCALFRPCALVLAIVLLVKQSDSTILQPERS